MQARDYESGFADGYDTALFEMSQSVQAMDRKVRHAELVLAWLIASSNGQLTVPRQVVVSVDRARIAFESDEENDTVVLRLES